VLSGLPAADIELYFYDQLGSYNSDRPDDDDLWTVNRFVDEVDQVRAALGLDASNFYPFGQSWGGILAIEYALAHQENLKGLIVSNMMARIPAYNVYARDVLEPEMDPTALAEIKALEAAAEYEAPRYMDLRMEQRYVRHVLRRPADRWPDYVRAAFDQINQNISCCDRTGATWLPSTMSRSTSTD